MAAAVVVANPLAPPVRDLQISTTQLSRSPEAPIPFDKNLLKSISQPSAASNFNAALAQILGALAAEADRISSAVNSQASTGPAAAPQTPQVYAPVSGDVPSGTTPNGTPMVNAAIAPAPTAASTLVFQQVVSDIIADTAYLGNKVVEAAYAAVNALVNTPNLIFKAVQAVLIGDLSAAFATIVEAIKAFFDPGLILVGGIDDVVDQYSLQPHRVALSASAAAAKGSDAVASPDTAAGGTGTSAADPETAAAEPGSGKQQDAPKTGGAKRATSQVRQAAEPVSADATSPADQPPPTPGSSAGSPGATSRSPGTGNSDPAARTKPRTPGGPRPGSASGRDQSSGGHGASADE